MPHCSTLIAPFKKDAALLYLTEQPVTPCTQ